MEFDNIDKRIIFGAEIYITNIPWEDLAESIQENPKMWTQCREYTAHEQCKQLNWWLNNMEYSGLEFITIKEFCGLQSMYLIYQESPFDGDVDKYELITFLDQVDEDMFREILWQVNPGNTITDGPSAIPIVEFW
jgi:hypothetical protein